VVRLRLCRSVFRLRYARGVSVVRFYGKTELLNYRNTELLEAKALMLDDHRS
jgi:hypothetical protein